ncbi:AAA family ATPase [bacterium]|nr:AAA family ATPase [bacterium]
MISKLVFENFRSLAKNDLELGKITIITGANNSGKSSIIYGLLALKNIALNSNQSLDYLLTPALMNLGGFKEVVHKKNQDLNIKLGIETEKTNYSVSLSDKISKFMIGVKEPKINLALEVAFPYPLNKQVPFENDEFNLTWNGIITTVTSEVSENLELMTKVQNDFNLPVGLLRSVDYVPLRRGFTKANFSPVPLQQIVFNEDELATLLANDRDLEGAVAFYFEKIIDMVFNVRPTLGTANFSLQTRDKKTGFVTDLVNEGFGTNELITILAKTLNKNSKMICIDEPEIHLHPSIISKLVEQFVEITKNEEKQFLISTHSEHFVLSLLNQVVKGKISEKDVKICFLSKDKQKTSVEEQKVNSQGQLEGGLKSFYEAELDELKTFFKISE